MVGIRVIVLMVIVILIITAMLLISLLKWLLLKRTDVGVVAILPAAEAIYALIAAQLGGIEDTVKFNPVNFVLLAVG